MTEKQKRFCDEYLIDCNGFRAYKAVYKNYKNDNVARVSASKFLSKPEIKEYINERLEAMRSTKIADAEEIMAYLTSVLRGETTSEVVVVEGEGDGRSAAKRIKKAPDEKERLRAAELLGKRYGIYTEKLDMKVEPITIVDNLKE